MVPWLATHRGATKAEIAARFGIPLDAARARPRPDHDGRRPAVLAGRLHQHRLRGRHRRRLVRAVLHPAVAAHRGRGPGAPRRRAGAARGARARIEHGPARHRARQARGGARRLRGRRRVRRSRITSTRCGTLRSTATRIEIEYWSAGRDELTTRRSTRVRRSSRWGSGTRTRTTTCAASRGCSASTASAASAPPDETFTPVPAGAPERRVQPTTRRPRGSRSSSRRRRAGSPRASPPESVEDLPDGRPAGRARGQRDGVARARSCSEPGPRRASSLRPRARRRRPRRGPPGPGPLRRAVKGRPGGGLARWCRRRTPATWKDDRQWMHP